jgi:hypothetical protein
MGMNLDGPLYLQRKGLLTSEKNKVFDVGPQNVYFVREEQIREFVANQGQAVSDARVEEEIKRLVYFSTPRPEERTTLFSEITDLTNIDYNSIDVCPGLKTEILDLNFDVLPQRLITHYDVVLNFGTTEHIFNQWNCFEVMHDATRVGGVIYHQLPASGYLDHGYYCYTPLFFREMAKANNYEIIDLFITPAGENKLDQLKIPVRSAKSVLEYLDRLPEDNRIPCLNIHAILRRTNANSFRCALEIATAHSPVNAVVAAGYGTTSEVPVSRIAFQRQMQAFQEVLNANHELISEIRNSMSWRVMQALRSMIQRARTVRKAFSQ